MADSARELALALINSGEKSSTQTFAINDQSGKPSGEEVVVMVFRTTPPGRSLVEKTVKLSFKAVAAPAGELCPMCGGTGRIK